MTKKSDTTVLISSPDGREWLDLPARWAADYTGRTLRTALRWAAGARIDAACLAILQARALGCLPDPAWQHWRLRGGVLVDLATGEHWEPWQLRSAHLAHQHVTLLKQRITDLQQARPAVPPRLHIVQKKGPA